MLLQRPSGGCNFADTPFWLQSALGLHLLDWFRFWLLIIVIWVVTDHGLRQIVNIKRLQKLIHALILFLEFDKEFLCMTPGLGAGPCSNVQLNFLPFLTVNFEGLQEFEVLLPCPSAGAFALLVLRARFNGNIGKALLSSTQIYWLLCFETLAHLFVALAHASILFGLRCLLVVGKWLVQWLGVWCHWLADQSRRRRHGCNEFYLFLLVLGSLVLRQGVVLGQIKSRNQLIHVFLHHDEAALLVAVVSKRDVCRLNGRLMWFGEGGPMQKCLLTRQGMVGELTKYLLPLVLHYIKV